MNAVLEKVNNNCIDVTSNWLNNKKNSYKVLDRNYFKDSNGNIHKVDDKYVVLDYSKKEKEIANWLTNTFGGRIYMIPRINYPKNIQTPDYIYNNESWDLKEIFGSSNQVIYHSVYRKIGQSKNFIIDISKSTLSFEEAKIQIINLYRRTDLPFIEKIILKDKDNFIIYKRK